jgi:hypothetical protein
MNRTVISALASCVAMFGAALAQECALDAEPPKMPNAKTATVDERAATIAAIKEYQGKLGEYRACLDAISGNEELEVDVRQDALDDYNDSVEAETKVVEAWQKFSKAYDKAKK